jgi:hypothetical protein
MRPEFNFRNDSQTKARRVSASRFTTLKRGVSNERGPSRHPGSSHLAVKASRRSFDSVLFGAVTLNLKLPRSGVVLYQKN